MSTKSKSKAPKKETAPKKEAPKKDAPTKTKKETAPKKDNKKDAPTKKETETKTKKVSKKGDDSDEEVVEEKNVKGDNKSEKSQKAKPKAKKSNVIMSKRDRRNLEKNQEIEENKESEEEEEDIENQINDISQNNKRGWPEYVFLKGSAFNSTKYKEKHDIQVQNFDLRIGKGQTLLKDAELNLIFKQKYGIVGRNGIGKSVLMRAIAKRENPFHRIPKSQTILMVEQEILGDEDTPLTCVLKADRERDWLLEAEKLLLKEQELEDKKDEDKERLKQEKIQKKEEEEGDDEEEEEEDEEEYKERPYELRDIYERLKEIEAYKAEPRARAILSGLGFPDEEVDHKKSKEYSGGWRMRIALARALFIRPALLILDEPTNHLDLHAAIWLEYYLASYPYTVLLVSHDESFLDTVVDNVIHFHSQTLTKYKGNYSSYLKQREQKKREKKNKANSQDVQIKKLQKTLDSKKGSKGGRIAKNNLEKLKSKKVEETDKEKEVKFQFPDPGKITETALLQFKGVNFGYTSEKMIFQDLDFGIYFDSRIGLVGANGVGKSTIMNLMLSQLKPSEGQVVINNHLRMAHFSQHHVDQLDMEVTPVEHLQRIDGEIPVSEMRRHLGSFGIVGNVALQKIESLSGGQKSRVAFSGAALKHPHIMLLDEPSNHLDIFAIQALAKGLQEYKGGLVVISHNQRLIEECCDQLWVVYKEGYVKRFEGTFQDYKEHVIQELTEKNELYTQN